MTQLKTVDPYLAHYVHEKQVNPKANLVWKAYEKGVVDEVDRIVELAHGFRDFVKSTRDWEIVEELIKFWSSRWPDEFRQFKSSIPELRNTRRAGGYSESKEIKYVGALPPRVIRLIKAIFPEQQFNKQFTNKFVRKFPLFNVGGRSNLGKGEILL